MATKHIQNKVLGTTLITCKEPQPIKKTQVTPLHASLTNYKTQLEKKCVHVYIVQLHQSIWLMSIPGWIANKKWKM